MIASVRVATSGGTLSVRVADGGIGGADESRGSGLRGLADRVGALGGGWSCQSRASPQERGGRTKVPRAAKAPN
jgi:signal transduction histidine kinase